MSAQVLAFKPAANDFDDRGDLGSAAAMFGENMLMELVLELARSSRDPHGRLAELFDRITTRARSGGVGNQPDLAQFRKHAERFFLLAARNV